MKRIVVGLLVILLTTQVTEYAYAYTDPGVGGVLYQITILVFSGIGFLIVSLKTKLFGIFRKRKNKL
jgi:hypothetical protein